MGVVGGAERLKAKRRWVEWGLVKREMGNALRHDGNDVICEIWMTAREWRHDGLM